VIRRFAVSVLAAQALALAELVLVLLLSGRRLASVWESHMGLLFLGPTLLVAAGLIGSTGAFAELTLADGRRHGRSALTLATALGGGAVGFGVGGGRHLAALEPRVGFALFVAACAGAAAWAAHGHIVKARRERPRALAIACFGAALLCELANRFVLVRLYPAFHAGLSVITLSAGVLGVLVLLPDPPGVRQRAWVLALVALVPLLLAVPASARRLSHFDNFRLVLTESAPLGGQAVALAARVAPPPSFDEEPTCEDPGACIDRVTGAPSTRTLDLRGRDVLLVTVDALRADHVGAYGYPRPTTPNLDRFAREGAVFERAYTPTPHTSYAVTSLMTGKYMRPLLLQGMGLDSDTWAGLLRKYGYRTAAFYPPAVFFIDAARFEPFIARSLDFEYRWVEFAEGATRLGQVERYLADAGAHQPLFVWVHLFSPHEPYEPHAEHAFGDRDIDRYDAEIAHADATLGKIAAAFLARRPRGVVIVTADHGEEFGDHGGRYHGTSVYEEQVRVPLVVWAPGVISPRRVKEPVSLIDLLPTVLSGMDIPRPPRLRGRDLGPLLAGVTPPGDGLAYAETDEQSLVASKDLRLVCARRLGACRLFDLGTDPEQRRDVATERGAERDALRAKAREIGASHGRFELGGLRAEGKGWPPPIRRAIAGDGDTAPELAELLDDADVGVRRKAAELLFELRRPESATALRLALAREEDSEARSWQALALTRLGQGAPLVAELATGQDRRFARLAALSLGEVGDKRGEALLIDWWRDAPNRDFERSRQILDVLAALRSKDALFPLLQTLPDVRLRPYIARALAKIGDDAAVSPLLKAFAEERLSSTRVALAEALVDLGAKEGIAVPLRRFLGVPDPLPGGVGLAVRAKILEHVGGPKTRDLEKLRRQADLGQAIEVVVPPGEAAKGIRVIVRARSTGGTPGEVVVSSGRHLIQFDREGKARRKKGVPPLDPARSVRLQIPVSDTLVEVAAPVPATLGLRPATSAELVVYASTGVTLDALSVVPLADELPPPAPKPWK
jgi:arylsulfatase A-like enzyme